MNLINFVKEFPDESSCQAHFRAYRESVGIICKKCGHDQHYWLSPKSQWQCKHCRFRTTLRSGTVMENSKLPFQYWYIAMHLLTSTKKSFSTLELQRQLGHKRYQPIWEMVHKLRSVMGQRDSRYKLESIVELDEGFFKIVPQAQEEKDQNDPPPLKRGRGSQKQGKVLVMVESEPIDEKEQKSKRPKRKPGHLRMVVIPDLLGAALEMNAEKCIDARAEVISDSLPAYSGLAQIFHKHTAFNISKLSVSADKVLPWVHIMISNAKRWFLGTYHMIGEKYLQNYLNEFCFKQNRRHMHEQLFDRLINAAVNYQWKTVA